MEDRTTNDVATYTGTDDAPTDNGSTIDVAKDAARDTATYAATDLIRLLNLTLTCN